MAGETTFGRITFDPRVMGRACIRGLRIAVSIIVSQVVRRCVR